MIRESGGIVLPGLDQRRRAFQFGVFELDPQAGELRKHGIRIKLQDQPLGVLILLLERAGQVVTREEIQKRLWPENTYVDFDHSINNTVRRLRDAIGDSAENPRFIETLAKRGYRFIAPVTGTGVSGISKKPRLRWIIPGAALAALAATAVIYERRTPPPRAVTGTPAAEVPLTSYPGFQRFPSFSPEGTRVAFTWDEPGKRPAGIYVKLIGSGEPVRLTNDAAENFAPAWSPDGRFIAFFQAHGALQSSVMVMPAVGGRERELTRTQFDATQIFAHWGWLAPTPYLAWSADSKWLLSLDSGGADRPHTIVRISIETGEKQAWPLTPGTSGGYDGYGGLAISPDGKTLAFTVIQDMPISDVYTIPLSKDMLPIGTPVRLTFDGKAIGSLAWAADGRSLVVSSSRRGSPELWRIRIPPSGEPARLNIAGYHASDVIVSKTGERLVYSRGFEDPNIWRIPLTGAGWMRASSFIASTRYDARPSYSVDGKRIAFESDRSGSTEIWICNEDGSDPVQLTSFGNGWAGSPAWSPDGQRLAFDSNAAGSWDVYMIAAKGGKPIRLTASSAADMRPVWSRDGKRIYYTSTRTGKPQIWKMSPSGGAEAQITKNGGFNAYESREGGDLYYAKTEGGVWSVPVEGGDEIELWPEADAVKCAPAKHGLYCIENANDRTTVSFLDRKTRSRKALAVVPGLLSNGLTTSPDDKWLLYTKTDFVGSELMLVENFR
jgi:Tol biopolymer transport system component/DNA-binding winged helix-turn-helix (wHTH) protein